MVSTVPHLSDEASPSPRGYSTPLCRTSPSLPVPLLTPPAKIQLTSYLNETPLSAKCFKLESAPQDPYSIALEPDDVLVQPVYLSMDTNIYMRIDTHSSSSHYRLPAFQPGETANSYGVGYVLASRHPHFAKGDTVLGWTMPWASFGMVPGGRGLINLKAGIQRLPLQWFVGVLGIHAFTAWYGLTQLAHPRRGQTLVVSAAMSGVGQMVVQLAGILGLKVVAIVGSNLKMEKVRENPHVFLAINYYAEYDLSETLHRRLPDGVDIYFDCVGGAGLDGILRVLNTNGRIILGGILSDHALIQRSLPVYHLLQLAEANASILGFRVQDVFQKYYPIFVQDMVKLIHKYNVTYVLDLVCGLENAPKALLGVFQSRNLGKCIVQVSQDDTDPPLSDGRR
ncbi:hypothetical protein IWQ62_000045 [Dispira parvispora]|uniref:Enoyl reductase (ER) domain-containing protein n=1 Tax=Dispira parvispora TaxID=1520584 RepID=A0A9W8B240_9FUNG|nr:hypothetical protein IWQ62_000045 [Dispira parvispora]